MIINNKMNKIRKEIPIFFSTDDNYVPFLAVSLQSMIENCSPNYNYSVKILNTGLSDENIQKISKYKRDFVDIEFVNVSKYLENIGEKLHTRDYYSKTTYFRLFIPAMYPQYKKCLYLDCDIVVKGDISRFYNINIGNNFVGAITDEFVEKTPNLVEYVVKGLGLEKVKKYFNAGILIMNLDQFRKQHFEDQFVDLLSKYKFTIAQDQDYLNVICKNKVFYISNVWDKMPMPGSTIDESALQIIHYNLAWKPWHFDDILYGQIFWDYAKKTEYYEVIKSIKDNYTKAQQDRDLKQCDNLINMAKIEADSPVNYRRLFVDSHDNEGKLFDLALAINGIPANT